MWRERRVWQRVDLETAQCAGTIFGVRKTNMMSTGAKTAAEKRNTAGNSSCFCIGFRFYRVVVGVGQGLREN